MAMWNDSKPGCYLSEGQVAALVGCSQSKLRQDRCKGRGIPYVKFGRSVKYSSADVDMFMQRNLVVTENANFEGGQHV